MANMPTEAAANGRSGQASVLDKSFARLTLFHYCPQCVVSFLKMVVEWVQIFLRMIEPIHYFSG